MESSTKILRRLLDERGVEWGANDTYRLLVTSWKDASGHSWTFMEHRDGSFSKLMAYHITPEQAIAATLGDEGVGRSNDGVAELGAGTCRRVYLVEVSDDLIESWCPLSVYLHREAAEDCAEALRKEEGGILQFARVSELKVVDDG